MQKKLSGGGGFPLCEHPSSASTAMAMPATIAKGERCKALSTLLGSTSKPYPVSTLTCRVANHSSDRGQRSCIKILQGLVEVCKSMF